MKLSIIIPCYNEEATIIKIISKINQQTDISKELIVVDDYSTDKTRLILENDLKKEVDTVILNSKNFGKGYSIRKGIEAATGDFILIQDADLEYDPSDYMKLLNPIQNGNADVVYGSRFLGTSERRVLYFWHTVGNKLLTLLSNMLSNLNLTDMEVGYKVFKSDLICFFSAVVNSLLTPATLELFFFSREMREDTRLQSSNTLRELVKPNNIIG